MPRARYQLTRDDVPIVHRWIRMKFREKQWPDDWPELTAFDKFPLDKPTAKKLQPWCDRFLDAAQWKQLQAVIRAARRDKDATRTVRLSQKASELLHTLAEREQLTLSATIEHYLSEVLHPVPTPSPAAALPASPALPLTSPAQRVSKPLWGALADYPDAKIMKVRLYLRVENNSKFVRGKKKAREEIEQYVLSYYHMEKPYKDRGEYILSIPYETDEDLEKTIYDILGEASSTADDRHCFIETDVVSVDDPDRSW